MIRLAELFSYKYTVFTYGLEKYFDEHKENVNDKIHICDSIEQCLESSNVVISAVPLSRDKVTVNSPYSDHTIKLDGMYHKIENKTFIAGGIPTEFYENKTIKNIDLLQTEELAILNAIPTAEGAIKIAIEESEITIHESNIMILGFGKIGKILCKSLKGLGANIYCTARKESDLAWIREERYIPVTYREIENYAENMDIVINTVPALVIDEKIIKKLNRNCFIIDVASNPGGVDKEIAKRYKIKVITALGIPGKIAPKTAAKYIKEIIEKKMK